MVQLGISHAATVRVGLAAGRGDPGGVHRAGWVALGLGGVYSILPIALFWFMPWTLLDLFLDFDQPGNLELAEVAVAFLGVAAIFQFVDGVQVIAVGNLRGFEGYASADGDCRDRLLADRVHGRRAAGADHAAGRNRCLDRPGLRPGLRGGGRHAPLPSPRNAWSPAMRNGRAPGRDRRRPQAGRPVAGRARAGGEPQQGAGV